MFFIPSLITAFKSHFFVHREIPQSIPVNVPTKVQFNVEVYDNNSEYDHETTFQWVCKKAGKYSVCSHVGIVNLTDGEGISLIAKKNTIIDALSDYMYAGGVGLSHVKVSGDVLFDVNDTLHIVVSHNMGADKNTTITHGCYLCVHRFA